MGNDINSGLCDGFYAIFQSTFPRGERLHSRRSLQTAAAFQSTFPRGERRSTRDKCFTDGFNFNPRSRVGNDELSFRQIRGLQEFQSTFPRGERQLKVLTVFSTERISIHVPAWGTTSGHMVRFRRLSISIHVPAWGTTAVQLPPLTVISTFQSTFPRGERRAGLTA